MEPLGSNIMDFFFVNSLGNTKKHSLAHWIWPNQEKCITCGEACFQKESPVTYRAAWASTRENQHLWRVTS